MIKGARVLSELLNALFLPMAVRRCLPQHCGPAKASMSCLPQAFLWLTRPTSSYLDQAGHVAELSNPLSAVMLQGSAADAGGDVPAPREREPHAHPARCYGRCGLPPPQHACLARTPPVSCAVHKQGQAMHIARNTSHGCHTTMAGVEGSNEDLLHACRSAPFQAL